MKYTVIRQHYGDKQFFEGDTREVANDSDAKALIKAGLIADNKVGKEEKAAPKAQNKMAKKTANKAE